MQSLLILPLLIKDISASNLIFVKSAIKLPIADSSVLTFKNFVFMLILVFPIFLAL